MVRVTMNVLTKIARKSGSKTQPADGHGCIGGGSTAAAHQAIRKKLFISLRVMRHRKNMIIGCVPHTQNIHTLISHSLTSEQRKAEGVAQSSSPMNFQIFSTAEGS
jgi:hypothetical protein